MMIGFLMKAKDRMKRSLFVLVLPFFVFSCNLEEKSSQVLPDQKPLFTRLTSEQTGISFVNEIKDRNDFNVFRYRNFYNGGGVAIGDINNDGLPDIFFTANMKQNRLY